MVIGFISGLREPGMFGGCDVAEGVPVCRAAAGRPGGEAANKRDRRDAGKVWVLADTGVAQTRRLARQSQAYVPDLQGRRAKFKKEEATKAQSGGTSYGAACSDRSA